MLAGEPEKARTAAKESRWTVKAPRAARKLVSAKRLELQLTLLTLPAFPGQVRLSQKYFLW